MNQDCKKKTILAGVCSLMLLSYSPQAFALPGLSTPPAVQQAKKVSGVVQDAMGPVIGASVKVKGTNTPLLRCSGKHTENDHRQRDSHRPSL